MYLNCNILKTIAIVVSADLVPLGSHLVVANLKMIQFSGFCFTHGSHIKNKYPPTITGCNGNRMGF